MAVRIYTLAKELKLDSKELVELCTRAGIQDKGSALASMSDEEVAKLKEFIAAKSRPAPPAGAAPAKVAAPVRPTAPATMHRQTVHSSSPRSPESRPPDRRTPNARSHPWPRTSRRTRTP